MTCLARTRVHGSSPRGFTYLGLLAVVAITGIGAAALGTLWHTAQQRDKERELLAIGEEMRHAIAAYVTSPGVGRRMYPRRFQDLLLDPRHPNVVRHLRRVYVDPMTGKDEWGLVRAADGGIMGVHSLSEAAPMKTAGFASAYSAFEGARRYSEWQFVYRESVAAPPIGWKPAPTPGR